MAKIVFYCRGKREDLAVFEYYKQDIDALRQLGHEVIICTRYREIPLCFDAMFIWWWTYALVPAIICKALRKPCIITGAYNFRMPPSFKGRDYHGRPWWQRFLIASATKLAALNLFVSEVELKECSSFFGLRNARHFPPILNEDYLAGPSADRELCILNISWSGQHNLVRKGVPELLDAMRILQQEGVAVKLVLAGKEGDGRQFIEDTVARLGLQERVVRLGSIDRSRKIELLRRCEMYAQPSHYEGFGLATAEAMGSGACVLTTDVGEVRLVVGDCGLYVTPGSADDLADGIKRVIADQSLRGNLQRSALARARLLFRAEGKLARLRTYLDEVGVSSPMHANDCQAGGS